MQQEAIILAGGLGTRLRSALPDLPKCMAPIQSRPFIDFVIAWLQQQGVTKFVFSLGYMHQVMIDHLNTAYPQLDKRYVIEQEPLGTGGAILLALEQCNTEDVWVLNGDTIFNASLQAIAEAHLQTAAICTLGLKPLQNFFRYGTVSINQEGKVTAFIEKQPCANGLINGGIYLLQRNALMTASLPEKFSFEESFLQPMVSNDQIAGLVQDGFFIDIGIPEDYAWFQELVQQVEKQCNDFIAFWDKIKNYIIE
jgi:D-glycero-alpha-D-manno-heptose 1-phosphate guanylyltransferase